MPECSRKRAVLAYGDPSPSSSTSQTPRFDWGLAMGLGVPRFAAHHFTHEAEGLHRVRLFTRHTLHRWGLHTCVSDATEVVTEVVPYLTQRTTKARPDGWLGL